jgi:polar amino acid transport system substrate-binding protein
VANGRGRRRALALAVLLAAPAGTRAADLPDLMRRGTLRALVAADEAPEFFALENGRAPGFERELLEAFARVYKLQLQAVRVARFDDIIPALLRGDGDVVTGIIDTEARRKKVAFTVEVLPSRILVVTRAPKAIHAASELAAERLGVVDGTTWAEAAQAAGAPAASIESFPDMPAQLAALRGGKVTGIVVSLSDFVLERRRTPELTAGPFLGDARRAAWAVRRADTQLLGALNTHLENLRRSPSWMRMAETYFGQDALSLLGRAKTE